MTPGSAVCACPGAAVWVWLHVCLSVCASEPVCVGLCDHCCSCRVCGGDCVCVFLDAQLCGNLCSVWVSGALVSLQARWVSSSLLAPPPPDAIRDCFHPPSSASGTLDFAPVAPTEALSPLLSLGPSSSWPPPVAVRGVHVGCGASPRGASPFCHRVCLGSAPSQL